ncbi:hypothetical protein [Nitratifractor sp.]
MVEFFKKMAEWTLNKEEELAKKCAVSTEEIDRQIEKVESKKEQLERECQENIGELEKILTKLKWIRGEALRCNVKSGDRDSDQATED